MNRPRLIIFASGTKDGSSITTPLGFSKTCGQENRGGGGSGFENLVHQSRGGGLDADIVAVVSNHEYGGVRARADRLGIPFIFMPPPYDAHAYGDVLQKTGIEPRTLWVALSGWLKKADGLDPARTFNIHPALLSFQHGRFGGPGLYGHRIHEAVKAALDAGETDVSGPTMHFTTEEYDRGPAFFEYRVPLEPGMTADDIAAAVNRAEHEFQPRITNLVVHGEISWDGADPSTLRFPPGYPYRPQG